MANSLSPLRYPGGKSVLTAFLRTVLEINNLHDCCYVEPFCGGAGAAIGLLLGEHVKNIHLNDIDKSVYSFWWSILNETDRFITRIENIPVTLDEWKKQKHIFLNNNADIFDRGFATFFLNRCNHSGILLANPIGGIKQTGKWKIDVRFNKKTLISRIDNISKYKSNIKLSNLDVFELIKKIKDHDKQFIYLDPPYIQGGPTLYLNSFTIKTHFLLSSVLREIQSKWIMTYDNADILYTAYRYCKIKKFSLNYSAHKKRAGIELLICPQHVSLPVLPPHSTPTIIL